MNKLLNKLCLFSLIFSFGHFSVASTELQLQWSIEQKFNMPESAAYDPKRQVIYVSNVNQYAKDDNGFISRVSSDGKKLELEWIKGLHSPTGLAVLGDKLFAVDYDALVVIDLNSEKIVLRAPAVDADNKPVLNDVALSVDGNVYVTGSRSRSIYKLKDEKLEVWLHDESLLKNANGLLVYKNYLLHGGYSWTAFDLASKQPAKLFTQMGKSLVDIDGITADGQGGFIVSLIDDHRLWSIKPGRLPTPLTEDEVKGIDMHYLPELGRLFIPRVGNTLSAYFIKDK